MNHSVVHCPGPISRRRFLKMGALTLGGLGMQGLLPLRLESAETGKTPDTSVILIWLPGGPPHMETYDMKPDAPAEYRGDFRPIQTNVPGIDVCELLAAARENCRQIHPRPLDRSQLRRPRRRPQAFPDRPRSSLAGRLRQRLPDGRLDGLRGRGQGRQAGVPNYIAGTDAGRDSRSTCSASAPPTSALRPIRSWSSAIPVRRSSRSRTSPWSQSAKDRLNERLDLLGRLDTHAVRARRQWHDGGDGCLQAEGSGVGDERDCPPSLRSVAGADRACASATACTPGASARCWLADWSNTEPAL